MDWPPIIALIVTYKRLPLAIQTIRSVKEQVDYPNIGFHLADDGSGKDHINALWHEIGGTYSITVSDSKRGGVGKNMNMGIDAAMERADIWLHLEDDWVLTEPIDLRPCVELLNADKGIGMISMGRLIAGVEGNTFSAANKLWWLLKKGCNTYVFNGNASLRHKRFWQAYGRYKEGLLPGQTELDMCGKYNNTAGPGIAWPAWVSCEKSFNHIGDHQSFKWHMEGRGGKEKTAEECVAIFDKMDAEVVRS